MPTPSPAKTRGSVVRQLSLQSPLQSPASQRRLKKQFSEDDTRTLEPVEITGQGWTSITERTVTNTEGKLGQKIGGTRPKPVRVAWADRKQETSETSGVEVIAKKCQGQPRPMSVKSQRLRSPLLGNKDTLVYSRLQLAERLRNAWSEREKMKPNLNIFLAHSRNQEPVNGSVTDRQPNDDVLPDAVSTMSETSVPVDKKRKSMPVRAFSQDFGNPELLGTKIDFRLKLRENFYKPDPKPQEEKEEESRSEEKSTRHLQELNKIEIRVTKPEGGKESSAKLSLNGGDESPVGGKRCRNKENIKTCDGVDEEVKPKPVGPRTGGTAQDRRADFRRSSAMNKTITESFRSEEKMTEESDNVKVVVTKPKKPPLVRAFSAPTPNTEQPSKPTKPVKVSPPKRLQPAVSFDTSNMSIDDITALRERIKSAPVRRKLKSAAARRKNKDKPGDSSEDEKETKETNKKMTRRSQLSKNGEIVTMVSLVSPAASDTEDSVINLPMESLTREEKDVGQTTTAGATAPSSLEKPKDSSQFVVEKFVSLRKSPKTVTFQSHPVLNRSYSASFPSRRAPAGTPIIIPTPVISNPALTPAQIQERDKRPPIFSAVASGGPEGRGIKRRLLRPFNDHSKEEESLNDTPKTCSRITVPEKPSSVVSEDKEEHEGEEVDNEGDRKTNGEPEFKSAKEKECWQLYQKMLEKGVSVSFDTVLRGMLTPTEYRLRKNQLLSSC